MEFLNNFRLLLAKQIPSQPPTTSGIYGVSSNSLVRSQFTFDRTIRTVLPLIVLGFLSYIILPSLPFQRNTDRKMFSKRPDKYTTGLINMRNDCFANSSIQAYSSLPGLTDYLNNFIETYEYIMQMVEQLNIDLDMIVPPNSLKLGHGASNKANGESQFDKLEIRLHVALAKIIGKLQETQMTTRTISVWTFLHELEKIYNAKISRSQHDAHELTQLINETLETENLNCVKVLEGLRKHSESRRQLGKLLWTLEIPEFPFNGLVLSQMKCLECSAVSKPHITPFLMLTLHPPQELSATLEDLLDQNESETITGYQCLKCRILRIVDHERHLAECGNPIDPECESILETLSSLNSQENLHINEDLTPDLEQFVKNYSRSGLTIADVTSSVFRRTQILKPPKVFGIHLSRSAFNGVTVSRNPCRVTFNDKLSLSIGSEYLAELRKFQRNSLQMTNSTSFPSKILTTNADDMEDASVQVEDVDQIGEETEDENGTELEDRDCESQLSGDLSSSGESETASVSSAETALETLPTTSSAAMSNPESSKDGGANELSQHFRKFKFNESNNYRYRLKALIRHQGSHTQGHYECYKRKPLFVKDSDGTIIRLSPEIDELKVLQAENFFREVNGEQKGRSSSNSTLELEDTVELGDRGNFRHKFKMIMNRRPSVIQADPSQANVQEIINSGLTTPAEVLVDEYFQLPTAEEISSQLKRVDERPQTSSRVKLKKIPSIIKHPYWRVGDSQVLEVSKSAVLFETTSVYMLYYERIDRKQVKSK